MKTKIHYECNHCHQTITRHMNVGEVPPERTPCPDCNQGEYVRIYTPPTDIDKQEDTVSWASQKMLHSPPTPSGKPGLV